MTPLQELARRRKNGTRWTVRVAQLKRIIDAEETLTALALNLDGDVVDEYTGPWEQCRAFAYLRLDTVAWKVELLAEHGEGLIGLLMPGAGVMATAQAHVPMPGLVPPRRLRSAEDPYRRARVRNLSSEEAKGIYKASTDAHDMQQPSGLSYRWRSPG